MGMKPINLYHAIHHVQLRGCVSTGEVTTTSMSFNIVITPTVVKDLVLVEFQRGKGDVLEFQEYYREFLKALGDMVLNSSQ